MGQEMGTFCFSWREKQNVPISHLKQNVPISHFAASGKAGVSPPVDSRFNRKVM